MVVDTNVLIRHLTGDPPAAGRRASALLEAADRLLLTDVVFAECVFVLQSVYGLDRGGIAEVMAAVLALPTIETADPAQLRSALSIYSRHSIDFADAYVAAIAIDREGGQIASFDKDFDRVAGVERVRP